MFLGYNTNGFPHHRLEDSLSILASIGYQGIGLTIDHGSFSPAEKNSLFREAQFSLMEKMQLRTVIETGARYLLDPWKKHEPTLLSDDPEPRLRFYRYAIDVAARLQSDCVSIWSGVCPESVTPREAWRRLENGLLQTLDYAASREVRIAFEPEPGMFIDTVAKYEELKKYDSMTPLGLTLDVGHLHCMGEGPLENILARHQADLLNVHLEDMRRGKHEHLFFGEGEMDFPRILNALKEARYTKGVYVELSRHGVEAPRTAERAFHFLQPFFKD